MKKHIKSLLCTLLSVLLIFGMFAGCSNEIVSVPEITTESITQKEIEPSVNLQIEDYDEPYDPNRPVIIPDEAEELKNATDEKIETGKDVASNEIIESDVLSEDKVFDEGIMEADGTVELENITYNGDNDNVGKGLSLLSSYIGRTYYSQIDSRWCSLPYTSCDNSSQTIGSSGCGPTSAAIIVSSMIGTIEPPAMCTVAQKNGYRTRDNGTAWAFWPFLADYFDFDDYAALYNWSKVIEYLNRDTNNDGVGDYMLVVSCGPGLYTSSGHYIVIYKADVHSKIINTLDPYYYNGKYSTKSRQAAGVIMSGNIGIITETNFKNYSNWKQAWAYKGTPIKSQDTSKDNVQSVNYNRYVATKSLPLTVRATPGGDVIGNLERGTKVRVNEVCGLWSHITSPKTGWVSNTYLSATSVFNSNTSSSYTYKTDVNKTYRIKENTTLYSNGNLSGTKYEYLAKTEVKILSHYTDTVDYVLCVKTGRKAYIPIDKITVVSSSTQTSTIYKTKIGATYRLKCNTYLNSNGTFTGTKYNYLAKTKIKVISHYSATVDRVYIVKLGIYRYAKVADYT